MWTTLFYIVVAFLFMFSPNLIAFATHGTGDLLLASGFTLDQWVQHLQNEVLAQHVLAQQPIADAPAVLAA